MLYSEKAARKMRTKKSSLALQMITRCYSACRVLTRLQVTTYTAFCVWQNFYNEKTHLCDFYITVFEENEDGSYERYDEEQRERMYTLRAMKKALEDNGFEFIGAYRDFDFNAADDSCERIYIAARCIKK